MSIHEHNVFVPQMPSVNILPASSFGNIIICWPGQQMMFETFNCLRSIYRAMDKAKVNDYILCVGDPSVIALASIVLYKKTGGVFRILKWDRQTKSYYSVNIDMSEDFKSEQPS